MKKSLILKIILSVTICLAVGGFSGYLTSGSISNWYGYLNKPFFNPPDWVFGPVWTILYTLMAIAIWNVWIKSKNINVVYLYFIHLFFNTTWSVVFFGFNQIELALINLIVLILFIVILFLKYKVISKLSAYLMIPYFLWCCFAFLLNLNLMVLN